MKKKRIKLEVLLESEMDVDSPILYFLFNILTRVHRILQHCSISGCR
jgi:hypothetical protein